VPSHGAVSAGIVLVPEGRAILQRMSVAENLLIGSEARPWPGGREEARAAIDAQIKRFPSLQRRLDVPAGALSGGEQQMLAIARGLLERPRILLLDEPSMGLAPLLVRQIFDIVRDIHREGTPSCWWSRMRAWRCRRRSGRTCWSAARVALQGRPSSSRRTRGCRPPIWAETSRDRGA